MPTSGRGFILQLRHMYHPVTAEVIEDVLV